MEKEKVEEEEIVDEEEQIEEEGMRSGVKKARR